MTDLEHWLARLNGVMSSDVRPDVIPEVLDLARDAAHNVLRPAAPLSAFVAGYAAGRSATGAFDVDAVLELLARASQLAREASTDPQET